MGGVAGLARDALKCRRQRAGRRPAGGTPSLLEDRWLHPNHRRLYYRCRGSRDFVRQRGIAHPQTLYFREEAIVGTVDQFLHDELGVRHLPATLRQLADAQHRAATATHAADDHTASLRETIAKRQPQDQSIPSRARRGRRTGAHRRMDPRDLRPQGWPPRPNSTPSRGDRSG
jgi:hypothetical protein